jgi:hypothetical protein
MTIQHFHSKPEKLGLGHEISPPAPAPARQAACADLDFKVR